MTRNARFWIWWREAPVKITLRPGQELSAGWHQLHEEGWSSYSESWSHEGDCVVCECQSDGRDCDGRMWHSQQFSCDLDRLHTGGINEEHSLRYPDWGHDRSTEQVYDEYAQAAGC